MKNRLFIRLKQGTEDAIEWGVWNPSDESWAERGQLLRADLVALAEKSRQCETIVIVPANDVIQREVATPVKQLKQIQKAVPYMLEEQLADSVEQIHFAYGARQKSGDIKVLWTSHQNMQRWLEGFEQCDIRVDALVHELSLLPSSDDAIEILLDNNVAMINEQSSFRWSCQRDLLPLLLEQNKKAQSGEEDSEDDDDEDMSELTADVNVIRLSHTGELEDYWEHKENAIANPIDAADILDFYVRNYDKTTISLLQQEYQPKRESNIQWAKYGRYLWVVVIALVIHLGYQGSRYWHLSEENTALREQGEKLYRTVFKKRARSSSLLSQTRRLLRGKNKKGSDSSFLKLLNQVSTHIDSLEKIKPTSVSFSTKKGELRMDVLAQDLQVLNAFKDTLKQSGLAVDNSSTSQQGNRYSTRLIIRSGS
ncbi:type II secretion system protein GspL [Pleionea sp. CnH1-48]|uniref:type II secretion system protein GspL n=1 Tax=Pleionea sp. CnH1-48 TaxID=2954494 RepID=UPI002096BD87|nr:type II secretion system protein GspL [Pleionea sp. CnH1-48]MCO7225196.1 type II secretion system protein GspL [Pleionea sp. CnH1-48]